MMQNFGSLALKKKSKFYLGRLKLAKRTLTIQKKNPQNNQVWEWEETPELSAFITKQTGNEVLKEKPTMKDVEVSKS